MDVLADVLSYARISGTAASAELSAPWGFDVHDRAEATFLYLARGECWLHMSAERRDVRLAQGDLVLLAHGLAHTVCDSPGSPLAPLGKILGDPRHFLDGRLRYGGGGASAALLWGSYCFEQQRANPLLSLLPACIHLAADALLAQPNTFSSIHLLARELAEARPGSLAIAARLVDVIFVQVIRDWAAQQPEGCTGWLGALRDQRVATALSRLHGEPARDWTVAALAREAGMSRAAFAQRFASLVGQGPVAYLISWRMALAARLLEETDLSLSEISLRVGYQSPFAFSKAFLRVRGVPPSALRERRQRGAEREAASRVDRT